MSYAHPKVFYALPKVSYAPPKVSYAPSVVFYALPKVSYVPPKVSHTAHKVSSNNSIYAGDNVIFSLLIVQRPSTSNNNVLHNTCDLSSMNAKFENIFTFIIEPLIFLMIGLNIDRKV